MCLLFYGGMDVQGDILSTDLTTLQKPVVNISLKLTKLVDTPVKMYMILAEKYAGE